ncbi:MAG: ADP-glyceromanno-heptose 6-epimerase [Candidatus Omnitrophica bacterium]|nr:ADP-glyceromanno-heptose 6-epimerase [Candidatus Omnitrophota bacterium]
MIILTGGAGFIGSCFLWRLNKEGISEIVVVDNLDDSNKNKKRNLDNKKFKEYIHKDEFIKMVEERKFLRPEFIIHMGACSSTILADKEYFLKNNYEYSKTLAQWALRYKVPFIYASSAATYGDGRFGYDDGNEVTLKLQPLNLYGYSKQLFDLWVLNNGFENKVTGIKFFNVFGPNEYHKGEMISVICKKFKHVREKGKIGLFKSYKKDYKDGEQKRDFIYIKDALEVMYYFFTNPDKTGIFNLGTGVARSWNDVACTMFSALGKEPNIEYIDMPEYLREKYQYFTQAKMDKLKQAGCDFKFQSLEDSVKDYTKYLEVEGYL